MSQSDAAQFNPLATPGRQHDTEAADRARRIIADLPDAYEKSTLKKEDLIGAVYPVSPAQENIPSPVPAISRFAIGGLGKANVDPAEPKHELHIDPLTPKFNAMSAAAVLSTASQESAAATPPVSAPANTAPPSTLQVSSAPAKPLNPLERATAAAAAAAPAKPVATTTQTVPAATSATKATPATHRKLPSKLKPFLTGLTAFILLFLIFKSPVLLSQLGYLTAKPTSKQASVATAPSAIPPETMLSIPKINVNAPIVFAQSNVESKFQHDLESGVVHYANTAQPGEVGNSVIFGHSSNDWWEPGNYKFVFVLLDKLVVGDTFTINYHSTQYVYQVTETKTVEPNDLSVTNQTGDPEITLITCTPPGTSWKRFIVRAKQISPVPSANAQKAGASATQSGSLPGNSPSWSQQLSDFWKSLTGGSKSTNKSLEQSK